ARMEVAVAYHHARRVRRAVRDEPVEPGREAVERGEMLEPTLDAERYVAKPLDQWARVEPVQPCLRRGRHIHQLSQQFVSRGEQLAWADAAYERATGQASHDEAMPTTQPRIVVEPDNRRRGISLRREDPLH